MFRALTTWLWRTHSFSSSEFSYSSGEMFRALTTCSNELGKKINAWSASGFVKLRFMRRRRLRHLRAVLNTGSIRSNALQVCQVDRVDNTQHAASVATN